MAVTSCLSNTDTLKHIHNTQHAIDPQGSEGTAGGNNEGENRAQEEGKILAYGGKKMLLCNSILVLTFKIY